MLTRKFLDRARDWEIFHKETDGKPLWGKLLRFPSFSLRRGFRRAYKNVFSFDCHEFVPDN